MLSEQPVPNLFVERFKFLAIGLAIGLVIAGGGAGYLWVTGQQEVADLRASAEADMAQAKDEADTLQAALDLQRRRAAVLGSRVEIARARQSLEQMNYGLVTQRLQVASQRLEGIEGADDTARRLTQIQIDPASPEVARQALDSIGGEVDALITD